jgi:hypothetical protein
MQFNLPILTPLEELAVELDKLRDLHSDLVRNMRDLSPAELYKQIESFDRTCDYVCGEVRIDELHKEQSR